MTKKEKELIEHMQAFWNKFVQLPEECMNERQQMGHMVDMIHNAIAARSGLRLFNKMKSKEIDNVKL